MRVFTNSSPEEFTATAIENDAPLRQGCADTVAET